MSNQDIKEKELLGKVVWRYDWLPSEHYLTAFVLSRSLRTCHFAQAHHQREPRLWIDKYCIDQNNIEAGCWSCRLPGAATDAAIKKKNKIEKHVL